MNKGTQVGQSQVFQWAALAAAILTPLVAILALHH